MLRYFLLFLLPSATEPCIRTVSPEDSGFSTPAPSPPASNVPEAANGGVPGVTGPLGEETESNEANLADTMVVSALGGPDEPNLGGSNGLVGPGVPGSVGTNGPGVPGQPGVPEGSGLPVNGAQPGAATNEQIEEVNEYDENGNIIVTG